MEKEKAKNELILPKIKQGEELVWFFQAHNVPPFWKLLLFGPFIMLVVRFHFIAITNQGIHFHKLSFWWKPDTHTYFTWGEIEGINLGKWFLNAPLKIHFSNHTEIKFKAQLKGIEKIAKLDEKTKEFILSKSL